jgi:predicted esterase YcpF (UPF0227 family)
LLNYENRQLSESKKIKNFPINPNVDPKKQLSGAQSKGRSPTRLASL